MITILSVRAVYLHVKINITKQSQTDLQTDVVGLLSYLGMIGLCSFAVCN